MTQEEQKVQELLKPRVKVIALWPFCQHHNSIKDQPKVGDIFEVSPGGSIANDSMTVLRVEIYPHLFRKLEWWEERDESKMPGYVKPDPNGIIESLAKSEQVFDARGKWELEIENFWLVLSEGHHIHASHLLPVTAADYHAYISSPELK